MPKVPSHDYYKRKGVFESRPWGETKFPSIQT
jgi:hypothetical protein